MLWARPVPHSVSQKPALLWSRTSCSTVGTIAGVIVAAGMWRVLLVYVDPHPRALRLTIRQHLDALRRLPDAWVLPYNAVSGVPPWLGRLSFDAVVLHTTVLGMRWSPWFEQWRPHSDWLAGLDALKIALPQDEYHHAETLDDWLDALGVSVVGTVLDGSHRDRLYPRLSGKAAFYEVLTGYIDDEAAERIGPHLRPHEERPFDVVYRARNLPYWLGSHGQLKHRIGEAVAESAPAHGLEVDISTRSQETVLGDAWLEFMAGGRATIGAESGASALDRRGEMQALTNELLADDPGLTFEQFAAQMPDGWDDYRFFAVSPRHLEAVFTKTAQVLVEGSYSGVLEADRHYFPVRRDFSNLDEALEAIRDPALTSRLAEQAYEDVYLSGRFSSARLTDTLARMLEEHAGRPRGRRVRFAGLVERGATAESEVERRVVAPLTGLARVGRSGHGELLAGLRLAGTDARARRLLWDYLRSSETRNHVGPRQALGELLALGALRRAKGGFAVEVDEQRRRLVISSQPGAETDLSRERLRELLREPGWEFLVDHSAVGRSISYPIAGKRALELPLRAGPSPLPVLNWLARYAPGDVAAALAPFLDATTSSTSSE